MSLRKIYFASGVVIACFFTGGCVTSNLTGKTECRYHERDLTVSFDERTYYCIPDKNKGQQ